MRSLSVCKTCGRLDTLNDHEYDVIGVVNEKIEPGLKYKCAIHITDGASYINAVSYVRQSVPQGCKYAMEHIIMNQGKK